MSEHRYPRRAVMADYARAGVGMALTFGPLLLVPASTVAAVVLGGTGLLFASFAVRTWLRQQTCVRVDEDGLAVSAGRSRSLAWRALSALELRYYATRREGGRGWMQLSLSAGGGRLRLESTLDGFADIAARAAGAAQRNGVALSPTTRDNLRALGIALDPAGKTPQEEAGPSGGKA